MGIAKQAMWNYDMKVLKLHCGDFVREGQTQSNHSGEELPVMYSGCKGFFLKSYKARHQLVFSATCVGVIFPMVSIEKIQYVEQHTSEFKELLNTLHLHEAGNYVKSGLIMLLIGLRLFNVKKKKIKKIKKQQPKFL